MAVLELLNVDIVNTSNNPLPAYESKGSAGMDIRADFSKVKNHDDLIYFGDIAYEIEVDKDGKRTKVVEMRPRSRVLIPTGIHIGLPEGYEAQIRPRSGLALKKGIMVTNSPGTIDNGYLQEIGIILTNTGEEPFTIKDGDRIAQMVVKKFETVIWNPVEELIGYNRGGGFGHTGKN